MKKKAFVWLNLLLSESKGLLPCEDNIFNPHYNQNKNSYRISHSGNDKEIKMYQYKNVN